MTDTPTEVIAELSRFERAIPAELFSYSPQYGLRPALLAAIDLIERLVAERDQLALDLNEYRLDAEKAEAELRRAWDSITEKEASAFSVETAADEMIATSVRATQNFCCAFNAQKKAEASLAEARKVIEPFDALEDLDPYLRGVADDFLIDAMAGRSRLARVTTGDLRAVRAWIAKQEPTP